MGQLFLRDIAELFYDRVGGELYKYRFFFQSKRAGSFFLHYVQLAAGDKPMILPEVTTLYSFLRRKINLPEEDVNNNILVIYELYQAYKEVYEETEHNFQSFYNIGRQLLADFNDIDMHLGDTNEIFKNLDQLEELNVNPAEYLDEEQLDALRRFVRTLDTNKSYDKGYTSFWQKMPRLYNRLKTRLTERGLIYNGMLMRFIAEQLRDEELDLFGDKRVNVFVGLNALTESEQTILDSFRQNGALFYWDYDLELLRKPFSDRFRHSNLRRFPEPEGDFEYDREHPIDAKPEQLEVISVPSKIGQSVYLDQVLLKGLNINVNDPNVAIILPDEAQLTTLLSNLNLFQNNNEEIKINITMGFPVREIPVAAKLMHVLKLQRAAYQRNHIWRREELLELASLNLLDIREPINRLLEEQEKRLYFSVNQIVVEDVKARLLLNLLGHNLIDNTIAVINELASDINEDDIVHQMVIKVLLDLLQKHKHSLYSYDSPDGELLSFELLYDIIFTTLSNARIPFEGEPLRGLQIMGVLEARTIDFETVIVLDASEGILPANSRQYGLIPQSIRSGYKLPTYKWQDDIRAYNFFHLVGRAKNVYALYDSRKSERSSGEPSRYLRLLEYVYGVETKHHVAGFKHLALDWADKNLELDRDKIRDFRNQITEGDRYLSPSRILQYITCPRRFYYETIIGLQEEDEINEIIDKRLLGNLVHDTMELLYPEKSTLMTRSMLEAIDEERIRNTVVGLFEKEFSIRIEEASTYNKAMIDTVIQVIIGIIEEDIKQAPFHYVASEATVKAKIDFGEQFSMNIGGRIDRLDLKDHTLRVIDYKTGNSDKFEINLSHSFNPSHDKTNRAAVQLFIYSYLLTQPNVSTEPEGLLDQAYSERDLMPRMLKPISREMEPFYRKDGGYSVNKYSDVSKDFEFYLDEILERIAQSDNTFETNNKKENCLYCSAKNLCLDAVIKEF